MKTRLYHIFFGLGIMLLVIAFIIAIFSIYQPTTSEKVDCFDRYGNEIIGETCLKEIVAYREYLLLFTFIGLGFVLLAVMMSLIEMQRRSSW